MAPLRILIADDQPLVRHGLRILMERHVGWTVCGEAADGLEALEMAVTLKPDVILLDVSMPKLDGLNALPMLRDQAPDSEIIILTLHECIDMARVAADSGASAYVAKSLLSTDLVPAIEAIQAAGTLTRARPQM
jgi:DNA-binding NarL/FixJ family response regulator